MIKVIFVFLVLLMSGCGLNPVQKTPAVPFTNSVANAWFAQGKIGITTTQNQTKQLQTASFEMRARGQFYVLRLSSSLSLWQMKIEKNARGMWVDDKRISGSLKAWMLANYGWYFPVESFGEMIFTRHFSHSDWQLKVVSSKQHYPRVIRLIHRHKPIKLKLILRQIEIE